MCLESILKELDTQAVTRARRPIDAQELRSSRIKVQILLL